jgi:hypothetical protein
MPPSTGAACLTQHVTQQEQQQQTSAGCQQHWRRANEGAAPLARPSPSWQAVLVAAAARWPSPPLLLLLHPLQQPPQPAP